MLELDFRAVNFLFFPRRELEPTPLIHYSTIRVALRPAPLDRSTTSTPYIYTYMLVARRMIIMGSA